MTYLMQFSDRLGRPVTLTGYKELITGGDDIWEETTLLLTQLHRGWLEADDDWDRDVIGAGPAAHPAHRLPAPAHDVPARSPRQPRWARSWP